MNYTIPTEVQDVSILDEYLLLDKIDEKLTTDSGFLLPFNKSNFQKGIVIKVGPGKKVKNNIVSTCSAVNDIVLYEHEKAKKVTVDEKTFYLIKESEGVLAKIGDFEFGELKIYVKL